MKKNVRELMKEKWKRACAYAYAYSEEFIKLQLFQQSNALLKTLVKVKY